MCLRNRPHKKFPVVSLCVAARSDYGKSANRSNRKQKNVCHFREKTLHPCPAFGFILRCRQPDPPSSAAG
jgi:hypothetical protein